MESSAVASLRRLVGRRVTLPGHFAEPVTIEDARPLGSGAELRVRLAAGELDEAVLSGEDLAPLLDIEPQTQPASSPADPEKLHLLVESTRIRLAYAYDRQFAVSLSGIRTLPHQIEAVYRKVLPQPRLRFLLADNPHERKRAQEEFRTSRQICVATEAAGEGINLQFCHLMVNYDLPWNPTRLEQRLGRIHRIGQPRDVYAFNFVATSSEDGQPVIKGRILERLLSKLDRMRDALGDRVFDVVGEVLSLNKVNLPDMLREVAYEPRRLDDYLDEIERIDPRQLELYEDATGIALARAHVDFSSFATANLEAEERRLMPRYVESHFLNAARAVGLRTESRADGLWRIEHVLADLRSERLAAVRRLGKPDASYRKLTFYKEHLEQDQHLDAGTARPRPPALRCGGREAARTSARDRRSDGGLRGHRRRVAVSAPLLRDRGTRADHRGRGGDDPRRACRCARRARRNHRRFRPLQRRSGRRADRSAGTSAAPGDTGGDSTGNPSAIT